MSGTSPVVGDPECRICLGDIGLAEEESPESVDGVLHRRQVRGGTSPTSISSRQAARSVNATRLRKLLFLCKNNVRTVCIWYGSGRAFVYTNVGRQSCDDALTQSAYPRPNPPGKRREPRLSLRAPVCALALLRVLRPQGAAPRFLLRPHWSFATDILHLFQLGSKVTTRRCTHLRTLCALIVCVRRVRGGGFSSRPSRGGMGKAAVTR